MEPKVLTDSEIEQNVQLCMTFALSLHVHDSKEIMSNELIETMSTLHTAYLILSSHWIASQGLSESEVAELADKVAREVKDSFLNDYKLVKDTETNKSCPQ